MSRPELNKCQCSLRIRVVGDGCPKCNPEYWEQYRDPNPSCLNEDDYTAHQPERGE